MLRGTSLLSVVLIVTLVGCVRVKLNQEAKFELSTTSADKFFTIDPIKSDQTIHVTATSDQPISVYVGVQKEKEDLSKEALAKNYSDKTLGKQLNEKSITLDVPIPANTSTHIMIIRSLNQTTNVQLKITN